ncbi:MAG: hypothetical protein JWN17_451 [Frankiales bacterium]|nr:hypothetical protein [Frankiales bacterium]
MATDGPDRTAPDVRGDARKGEADAWGAFGLVVSGVLVWGGVGWFVSDRLDNRLPLLVGLLVGMFAGLYLVWFRYGRA